jgi:hypothetical protein
MPGLCGVITGIRPYARYQTPAEQRKLVDEFLASPRSRIRDPLSERDQLLHRLGESPDTVEKTCISEQIEALDAADAGSVKFF